MKTQVWQPKHKQAHSSYIALDHNNAALLLTQCYGSIFPVLWSVTAFNSLSSAGRVGNGQRKGKVRAEPDPLTSLHQAVLNPGATIQALAVEQQPLHTYL